MNGINYFKIKSFEVRYKKIQIEQETICPFLNKKPFAQNFLISQEIKNNKQKNKNKVKLIKKFLQGYFLYMQN